MSEASICIAILLVLVAIFGFIYVGLKKKPRPDYEDEYLSYTSSIVRPPRVETKFLPQGSSDSRRGRRLSAIVNRKRRITRPVGLVIPEDMYWDDLLGELCYIAEQAVYLSAMQAYDSEMKQWEEELAVRAQYDTQDPRQNFASHDRTEPDPEPVSASYSVPDPEPVRSYGAPFYESTSDNSSSSDDDD